MSDSKKLTIQTWSAIAMLASGTVMAYINMWMPPKGEISNGVLWYVGQCFCYAGGAFGIAAYATTKLEITARRLAQELSKGPTQPPQGEE